jgi:hypothetical protein
MIDDLLIRAKAFFLKRFAGGVVGDSKQELRNGSSNEVLLSFGRYLGLDFMAGVKLRGIAIEDLGKDDNHILLAQFADETFSQADRDIGVTMGNPRTGMPPVSNAELPFSKRVMVYTNRVHAPLAQISNIFMERGVHIQVVSEEELFRTVFISYGGTDAEIAGQISEYLTAKGIKTWFFPKDAVPGQKLHRVMHDAVNSHDRVLLLCSKESLARPGVLNEIERVLEREAKEGGSDILIPVALDDHVYQDWASSRPDIAEQVRSRVIAKLSPGPIKPNEPNAELDKLVDALSVGK